MAVAAAAAAFIVAVVVLYRFRCLCIQRRQQMLDKRFVSHACAGVTQNEPQKMYTKKSYSCTFSLPILTSFKMFSHQNRYVMNLEDLKKIKWKCLSVFGSGVILQHGNTTPCWLKITMAKVVAFGWSVFLHPTNCPDLMPSDYHLFPKLKQFLGDKHLRMRELKWFQTMDTQFYMDGMNK